ncbi:hypothetical protein H4219_000146 [Mycoemilia scoparia]|uniref:Centrosomal protein of 135 kDa n=1 Tax=Mycoemilia scoparia TaxID=417184 RepID=A0A9W8DRZ4_9FUNG|nr:hypothetical protein H4219_000146 [Mycoemilia scoparia]
MSATDGYEQTREQLLRLSYTEYFPEDALPLVQTLLSDLQVAVTKLKALKADNEKLSREDRTFRTENQIHKTKLRNLQQDNNRLRAEVLEATRISEQTRRDASVKTRQLETQVSEYELQIVQLNAEKKNILKARDEERRRVDLKLREIEMGEGGDISLKMSSPLGRRILENQREPKAEPYVANLIDLNERRISALEKEVEILEQKNNDLIEQLDASQYQIETRDLEIQRLNTEMNRINSPQRVPRTRPGANRVQRLEDQIDYLQEHNTQLEKILSQKQTEFDTKCSQLKEELSKTKQSSLEMSQQIKEMDKQIQEQTQTLGQLSKISTDDNDSKDLNRSMESRISSKAPTTRVPSQSSGSRRSISSDILIEHAKYLLKDIEENINSGKDIKQTTTLKRLRSVIEQIEKTKLENKSNNEDMELGKSATSDSNADSKTYIGSQTEWDNHMKDLQNDYKQLRADRDMIKSLYEQVAAELQRERQKRASETSHTDDVLNPGAGRFKHSLKSPESELQDMRVKHLEQINELQKRLKRDKQTILDLEEKVEKQQEQQRGKSDEEAAAIESLNKKNSQISEELDMLRSKNLELQNRYEVLETSLQEKISTAKDYQERYSQLVESYTKLTTEHEKLDHSLKNALMDVYKYQSQVVERDSQITTLEKSVEEYKVNCQNHSTELKSTKAELANITADLKTLRTYNEHDREERSRLGRELKEAHKLRKATELSKDEYKRLLSDALKEAQANRDLISQIRVERESLAVQLSAQLHRCQRLEQQLEMVEYRPPAILSNSHHSSPIEIAPTSPTHHHGTSSQ